ncbi:MAG: class I SAM-dependent methyltransferase [Endomicrobia bacterium]|nr:class I SAM-dependent methyltransferase [Endomicrobiia bacterium]
MLDYERISRDIEKEKEIRDQQAKSYDEWYLKTKSVWWHKVELKVVISMLKLQPTDILLDAGCGTGLITLKLAPYVKTVYGIDHSPKSIDILLDKINKNDLSNVYVKIGDICDLPFEGNFFDKIVSTGVIQHIPSLELRAKVIKEFFRVLKPKGRVVFTVYRWKGMIRDKKEGYWSGGLYYYAFSADEIYGIMREIGYENIKVMHMFNLPFLRKLGPWAASFDYLLTKFNIKIGKGCYLCVVGEKR